MAKSQLSKEAAVESVLRLRQAERTADDVVRSNIAPVRALLEEVAGPTVGRATAARLLDVSQTALDRWISNREISAVLTPRGRREIPLPELVDLLEDVRAGKERGDRLPLASVIQDRRRKANALDTDELLPEPASARGDDHHHRAPELRSLAYHRALAGRLDQGLVDDALERLRRWQEAGRIHPRWAKEWEHVLAMPIPQIAKLISFDREHERQLRQSSPFAGALTEQERRRVLRSVEAALG